MNRLILLQVLVISLVLAAAVSPQPSIDQYQILLLYKIADIPPDAGVVLRTDLFALAFGDSQSAASSSATRILPDKPGEYYVLRIKSAESLKTLSGLTPHVVLGDMAIVRTDPENVSLLGHLGWGLTRLRPRETSRALAPPPTIPTIAVVDSNIINMISVITPESSRVVLADISRIYSRFSYVDGCRQAEQYVYDKLNAFGLQSSFFNYEHQGIAIRNVVGQKPGEVAPDSIIIVCAHLDSYSESPFTNAPGAEDNGSGCTAAIEAARALAPFPTDLTVRFIAFTGEEQGLIGSDIYADSVLAWDEAIAAVINLDMVAYTGSYALDMHVFSDSLSSSLGALGAEVLATYTSVDTVPHYELYPRWGSDHYSFAVRGFPSIFFIDAWDGYDWYPYYHTTADTIGNLNMELQAYMGRAGAAMAAILARSRFRPVFLPGDANSSGDVNGLDVVYLVNYLKGYGPPPDPLIRGDANGDCVTNGMDVVYLVNYLRGWAAPVPGNCR